MSVKVADKIVQMNGQNYPLMDSSAVEYKDINGNTIRVDKCLDNKLDKEDGKSLLSATDKAKYDDAVTKAHKHINSTVLDKFDEDVDGNPTYNGKDINTNDGVKLGYNDNKLSLFDVFGNLLSEVTINNSSEGGYLI